MKKILGVSMLSLALFASAFATTNYLNRYEEDCSLCPKKSPNGCKLNSCYNVPPEDGGGVVCAYPTKCSGDGELEE